MKTTGDRKLTMREVAESDAALVAVMKEGNSTTYAVYVGHVLKYLGSWYIVNEHGIMGGPYDSAPHATAWANELRRMTSE